MTERSAREELKRQGIVYTPYDKPRTLWEHLTFPILKDAFREGFGMGYCQADEKWERRF